MYGMSVRCLSLFNSEHSFLPYFASLSFIVPSGKIGLAAAIKNTTEDVLQTTYKMRGSCLTSLLLITVLHVN